MTKILFAALPLLTLPFTIEAAPQRKQETIKVDENRFLIFAGETGSPTGGFTVDLIVMKNNAPTFEPLFTEEFDVDTRKVNLSEGMAFIAENYHFDTGARLLTYSALAPDKTIRYQYKYKLATDIFTLQEVISQEIKACEKKPCPPPPAPKTLFRITAANKSIPQS